MTVAAWFLCRHGQTEWNTAGRRQGQLDSPLTNLGRGQAGTIASSALELGVDAIFCSPLGRATQTASIISNHLETSVVVIDELAELHHGSYAGMTDQEIERRFPGQLEQRERDKYLWCFPGGESYADADVRATRALGVVAESGSARPLIVSHAMITRVLLRNLLGLEPGDALAENLAHGVVRSVTV